MLVADSSVLIAHLRGKRAATSFLRRHLGEGVVIPAVAAFELWCGAQTVRQQEKVTALLEVLPVDAMVPAIARVGGDVQRSMRREGRERPVIDLLIAAHALHHSCGVATMDRDYDGIPGLDVVRVRGS